MTIGALYDRFQRLNTDEVIESSVDETKENILDLNKEQLLEGKMSTGADITPSYLDDPYFKSRESAQRYSDWKDRITPNPNRRPGTPNLFITGVYHESIRIEVDTNGIKYTSSGQMGAKIEGKYGDDLYGLSSTFKQEYLGQFLGPLIRRKITELTGLKFG